MTKDEVKKLRMDSPESLQFLNNATKFYNLMMMYRCAIREIQTKLEVLDDEFSVENNRNPISFIKTRIKKPNSIYDKLQKMGYEFTTENIQTYLNDVAGVRIVCAFIDDIYMISDLITQQDDIKVIEIKDYIKNPKSNGYRSYHMIVEIPVFFAKGKTPMRVELQIRTNGMDFWATLEHQLRYKKGIEEMPGYDEISEELLHSARAIIEADGADWHGKIVTFLLYGTVAVHIIWFHITPMVSDLLIGLCAIMMVVSVVLYIIKNTRTLRGETA